MLRRHAPSKRGFKSPMLKKPSAAARPVEKTPSKRTTDDEDITIANKRLKISPMEQSTSKTVLPKVKKGPRRFVSPAVSAKTTASSTGAKAAYEVVDARKYFKVVWCKYSRKKHKTWENDAFLEVIGTRRAILRDTEGKEIGKAGNLRASDTEAMTEGSIISMSGKEVQLLAPVSIDGWQSGSCFLQQLAEPMETEVKVIRPKLQKFKPMGANASLPKVQKKIVPRHEVRSDSCVMPRPPRPAEPEVVDVVVDPYLGQHLRPHQREGIKFMYECVMGFREHGGCGAILADEMGLGKTIQTIALIWTLLRQGPYGKPVVNRVVVVCPSSLVGNWKAEFRKWLGSERISVYCIDDKKTVADFQLCRTHQVLVVSYEMFLRNSAALQKIQFGLVVCDEAQRLKSTKTKTSTSIAELGATRRVALTGTPVQNDLQEFFSLVDFVNPGFLSSYSCFRRIYEAPILAAQQPSACPADVELGERRSAQFAKLIKECFLRRTSEVNAKFLPPKSVKVVFVPPTDLQIAAYRHILSSRSVRKCLEAARSGGTDTLLQLNLLKRLCNSPKLLYDAAVAQQDLDIDNPLHGIVSLFPEDFGSNESAHVQSSSKLVLLDQILREIAKTDEKVVVVSSSTKCLDIIGNLCERRAYSYARLDGTVASGKRMEIVNHFNTGIRNQFVFLLSAKAGGTGLNLTAASRLIMFDVDWNPATDLQAMARIWRPGQKRPVHIYRLLTTGTLDEKIFQRQVSKQSLDGALTAESSTSASVRFSREDLKRLFKLNIRTKCETHELLGCDCEENGTNVTEADATKSGDNDTRSLKMDELNGWKHFSSLQQGNIPDDILPRIEGLQATFLLENTTTTS